MPRSVTLTIADHSTHHVFTAVHHAPRRSLIECYNFSDMPQTVTQALATMAPASAAASLSATEAPASRLASSLSR